MGETVKEEKQSGKTQKARGKTSNEKAIQRRSKFPICLPYHSHLRNEYNEPMYKVLSRTHAETDPFRTVPGRRSLAQTRSETRHQRSVLKPSELSHHLGSVLNTKDLICDRLYMSLLDFLDTIVTAKNFYDNDNIVITTIF